MEIENSPQGDKIYVEGVVIRNSGWSHMWPVFQRKFLSPHSLSNNRFLREVLAENQSTLYRNSQFELELLIKIAERASTSSEHKSPSYCIFKIVGTINFRKWNDSPRGEGVSCAVLGVLTIEWARRLLCTGSDRQVVLLNTD